MIPKRAFFVRVGDKPLSWLRQLSVDSFRKFNPDWDVNLITIPPKANLVCAQTSDIFRYHELAFNGGFYFDTDIVFFEPFPDALLDANLAVTIDKSPFNYDPSVQSVNPMLEAYPGFTNIAVMGCSPGSPFFLQVYQRALELFEQLQIDNSRRVESYQVFGVEMLNRLFFGKTAGDIAGLYPEFVNIPLELVLPISWDKLDCLYNGTPFIPQPATIGVHWYGGSVEAKRYCSQVDLSTYRKRPCYLSRAIDAALA